MTAAGPVSTIELEAAVFPAEVPEVPPGAPGLSRRFLVMGMFAAMLAGLVGVRLTADEGDGSRIAEPAPGMTDAARPTADRNVPAGVTDWPEAPAKRAPGVSGSPRTGQLLVERGAGMTLVYVNTIGRTTVLDLEQGQRQELHVSPGRPFDYFLVEDGHVVDADPLDRDLPLATVEAVPFFVHQPRALGAPGPVDPPSFYAGPHLCLDNAGCDGIWWRSDSFETVGYEITRSELDRIPELEPLLDPTRWTPVGRFLESTAVDGPDFRIPVPRHATDVWVIRRN